MLANTFSPQVVKQARDDVQEDSPVVRDVCAAGTPHALHQASTRDPQVQNKKTSSGLQQRTLPCWLTSQGSGPDPDLIQVP